VKLTAALSITAACLIASATARAEQPAPVTSAEPKASDPAPPATATEATPPNPNPNPDPKDDPKAWETAPATHRGGFAIGLMFSGGVGASNGYPADAKKVGRYDYYTESGLGFAGAPGLWLGGALADWLTFGVGGGFSTILNGETRSPAPFMFFHVDTYPLFWLGGQWRNLGLMGDFGLGFPTTLDTETEETLIDGTGASMIQGGVFWEGIQPWKLKMGPYLAAHYMFSDTIRRPTALLGFRISLYTAP
jgi:hypothetical protein